MRDAVAIDSAGGNYSGDAPDLPWCITVGPTAQVVEMEIGAAIRCQIAGRQTAGSPIPAPSAVTEYIFA